MNPFNPIPIAEEAPNKRLGFFGTALQDDDEVVENEGEVVEVVYVDEDGNEIEGYEEQEVAFQKSGGGGRGFAGRRVTQGRTTFAVSLRYSHSPFSNVHPILETTIIMALIDVVEVVEASMVVKVVILDVVVVVEDIILHQKIFHLMILMLKWKII